MSNIHSLSLFVLLFLLSDSLGAVIQPRLDDSFNHRRSMLGVRNRLPIEARVHPYLTARIKSPQKSNMAQDKQPGTGGSSVHSQRDHERSVFYADLSPWALNEFKTGPSLLVVLNSPENFAVAKALIKVEDPGNNLAYMFSQTVFSCVPGDIFSGETGEFVIRYMPWAFFHDKVAIGKIEEAKMDDLQPKPIRKFEPGDIVQILNDEIRDGDESADDIRTAICLNHVRESYTEAYFAVLSSDPGEKPFHPAVGFTIPTGTENPVFLVLKALTKHILKIGELNQAQREKIKTDKIKSQSPTSIRPRRFVNFLDEYLFRLNGDPRKINFGGRKPFGIVLGPPHGKVGRLTPQLPVGVFLLDENNDWPGAYRIINFEYDKTMLRGNWKMVPGDVDLTGVTAMQGRADLSEEKMRNYWEAAYGSAEKQPGPHISHPPCDS